MDRDRDRIRFLEAMYDHWQTGAGTVPDVGELFGMELDAQQLMHWRSVLDNLAADGLIRTTTGMGNPGGYPTSRGEHVVEDMRRRRKEPAERRAAAAIGLLRWLDLQDQGDPAWTSVQAAFSRFNLMGDSLSEPEIRRAVTRLEEEGLVEVGDDPVVDPPLVRITTLGQRCVESRLTVDEFLRHERSRASVTTNNLNGDFRGNNIALSSSNFAQTLSSSGDESENIRLLLDAVAQALPVLGLGEREEESVRRSVDVVRSELEEPEQNTEIVKGMLKRLADGVGSSAGSALGGALNLLTRWQLARMGVPLE